jgi:DNA-binding ferritin-like protein
LQDTSYEVAERVRSIGELANISISDVLRQSIIRDQTTVVTNPLTMIRELLLDYAALTDLCRQIFKMASSIGDAGTIGLLTKTTLQLEHFQWEMRSMSEKYTK